MTPLQQLLPLAIQATENLARSTDQLQVLAKQTATLVATVRGLVELEAGSRTTVEIGAMVTGAQRDIKPPCITDAELAAEMRQRQMIGLVLIRPWTAETRAVMINAGYTLTDLPSGHIVLCDVGPNAAPVAIVMPDDATKVDAGTDPSWPVALTTPEGTPVRPVPREKA